MDLPKPYKRESLHRYNRRISRESMPLGTQRVKYSKSQMWKQASGRSSNTVVLDLEGPCKGPIGEVMELGLKEASHAIDQSKMAETPKERAYLRQSAGKILRRLNELPREYAIYSLLRQLKAARKVQRESTWEERIIKAKERELDILQQLLEYEAGKKGEIIDTIIRKALAA